MTPTLDPEAQTRIRKLGFRITPQRRLILEAIERAGEHATFDEIYQQVKALAPKINQATVYRTLQTFSRYRLIHGNEIAGGRVYEMASPDKHHHLLCHLCWTDEKLEQSELDEFYKQVDKTRGFLVLSEHMIFMGLCEDCRKEEGDVLGRFTVHPKFKQKAHKEE